MFWNLTTLTFKGINKCLGKRLDASAIYPTSPPYTHKCSTVVRWTMNLIRIQDYQKEDKNIFQSNENYALTSQYET